ncbi:MAG: hypothetical protein WCC14_04075 [Acidobacteriaceae bacterium]
MRLDPASLVSVLVLAAAPLMHAQSAAMNLPQTVTAGSAFSIPTSGSGQGTITIVGPAQALRRNVQLGEAVSFPAGVLYDAGAYVVILDAGSSISSGTLQVTPASQPATLSFLAEPSRLPVSLPDGISGAAYVFDAYHNLITQPLPVAFSLTGLAGGDQTRSVTSSNGVAWTRMNSAAKEGSAKFIASADGVSSTRIIEEVPGDPCNLTMSAKPDGASVLLATAPVRDCSGNPVPDGTIVTFTESYEGMQSTADVPLKRDIASVEMPAHPGATISVASGVVAGNEIRWEGH